MNDTTAVQEVEHLFRRHFAGIRILIDSVEYQIENYHPSGIVHVSYVFGGIRELIEEFVPYVEIHFFEASVRNRIIDKHWIEHTLRQLRESDSLEGTIRRHLTDPDGKVDGRLFRFVVAMLRARDPEDEKASVSLADLRNQPCLEPFRGQISTIANELRSRGIIAREGDKYRLRVLFPLFSRGWWQPHRLGW